MVERVRSTRAVPRQKRGRGRPRGGQSETRKVAIARARLAGKLPDELLLEWARTGRMAYAAAGSARTRTVELEPSDRIACAKGAANFYKAPYQARPQAGEQPPVYRIELDEKMVAALAARQPEKLEVLRDVLRALRDGGGGDLAQVARGLAPTPPSDSGRYGRMLSETSDVGGSA